MKLSTEQQKWLNSMIEAIKADGMTDVATIETRADRDGYPEVLVEATGIDGHTRHRGWLRDGESVADIKWYEA